ncbi:hypothetical protein Hdeb2414_s0001g00031171 [Helianthus debilis subsp. tardiflorus]
MENYDDDCTFNNINNSAFERLNISIKRLQRIRILASRLDRAVSLKREVELKEKAAEEAKVEAGTSSLDILAKVEALKQAQQPVKETNDMVHAREVFAQKAVLVKELKELQLRMSCLLNEGRRSFIISDEMHRVLKRRLTKAYKEKEVADKVKVEKEKSALKAPAFEKSQVLKLVKESERLKQEAVENSKVLICKICSKNVNLLLISYKHLDGPVLQRHGLSSSSQISADRDLKEQKGNMNGSSEVKSIPVVADITKGGHSVSNKSSVASAQTNAEWVAAPVTGKHVVKKWKIKEKDLSTQPAGEIYRG